MQKHAQSAVKRGLYQYTERHGYKGPVDNWGWPSLHRWESWQKKLAGLITYENTQAAVLIEVKNHSSQALLADGSLTEIPWHAIAKLRPQSKWGWPQDNPQNAHDVLSPGDVVYIRQQPRSSQIVQIPEVEGSFIAMDPHNGAIKALVGGFSFKRSHFIRPLQALRQPGSSFKPFLYSAALAHGYTLADILNDTPVVLNDVDADMIWRPKNAGNRFHGSTSLRQALIHSRNLISIRLLQKLGIPKARQFIERFGFDSEHLPHSLSLALGSGVTTSKQLTKAISTFANGGHWVDSYIVDHVEDQFDQLIYHNDSPQAYPEYDPNGQHNNAQAIITPENAYLINDTLHSVIQSGTGQKAKMLGRDDIAGKTGTTNQLHDAWFTGYHPDLAATSWVGYDDPKNLHEYGNQVALSIWMDFMQSQLADLAYNKLAQPPDIIAARINPKTGKLAAAGDKEARFELFRRQNLAQHARSSKGKEKHHSQYLF
jgi:penicillin-binding protein 1A